MLETAVVETPRDVAEATGTLPGQPIFRINRLRTFEQRPLAFHEAYLPIEIGKQLSGLDLTRTSIIREIDRTLKIPSREAYQRVEAVCADTGLARMLDVALGAPLLYVTRLVRQLDGRLLVLFRSHFRADRYYYTVEIAPARKRPAKVRP